MADSKIKESHIVLCEQCRAKVAATVEGAFETYVDGPDCSFRYLLLRCPGCSYPLVASQDDEDTRYGGASGWSKPTIVFPESDRHQLGFAVPEAIRMAFAEARSCFDNARAYTACAIMCRKVLEGVCVSHQAKGKGLAAQLKNLFDRGEIDRRLYDWITALRLVGNEAAHDVEVTVSREDASDLLDFTEAVAEYLYTFKEKFEVFQKRRSRAAAAADSSGSGGEIVVE